MSDLNREMLLGYLTNALEDDEIAYVERELLCQPALRTELAMLQKELSPLTYVYESVDPPYNLAQRTCRRLWKHLDQMKQNSDHANNLVPETLLGSVITMTIPASHFKDKLDELGVANRSAANYSVPNPPVSPPPATDSPVSNRLVSNDSVDKSSEVQEKILTVSPSQPAIPPTTPTEHSNSKRLIRRLSGYREHSTVSPSKHITKNRRWFDVGISIAVGILIAVIAFPVINYIGNRTQNYFTKSKIHEINKSIDHYTQLQRIPEKTTPVENSSPINLTQSGWQELKPAQFPVMLTGETAQPSGNSVPIELFPGLLKSVSQNSTPFVFSEPRGRDIILGQTRTDNSVTETFPPDPHKFIDQTLISEVNPLVSNFDGSTVQTAYGQNVLFHNGRIFFRILPVFTPKE
ncbi:MAG: hypothetical protein LBK82_08700 [Planctomycetaceae bacterium]|jgi:hypothetical protein|nr:hypothetical protein [Planctomycetaceae bacterium]